MRTRPVGVIAALIAVAALVVLAGPAATRSPGDTGATGPRVFAPVVLDRPPAGSAAPTPPLTGTRDGTAPVDAVWLHPATAPQPTRPPRVRQPAVEARVHVKPTRAPRPVQPATGGSGGWRWAEYSWYGKAFFGNGTACGQTYSRTILGVAHKTLPCGTRVTFRNPRNGRVITVKVIDRGPYVAGRTWDLSRATCVALDNCYTARIQWRLP